MSRGPLADHPQLAGLVARARRRLRAHRALAAAAPALVIAAGAALAWVLAARVVVLAPAGWLVAALAAAGVAAAAGIAAGRRIPPVWAAWAADVWLSTRDRFATAVELVEAGGPRDGVPARHVAAAEAAAGQVEGFPVRPPVPTRLLGVGAALALAAGVLGTLPNPMDAERDRRAADAAAVAEAAELLDAVAEPLRDGLAAEERADLAERLEALAQALEDATLEEALAALDDAQADLAGAIDDHFAAQRTALAGLEQELARAGAEGGDAAERLGALADAAAAGALDDPDALAERLEALAGALAAPPGLADALARAGAALVAGQGGAAAEALRAAAAAAGEAARHVDAQSARAQAAAAAAGAASPLRGRQVAAGEGGGQGAGDGAGERAGQGAGEGEGQGAGEGEGQGAGEGGGQGAGEGGGQGAGEGAGQGAGQGAGSGQGAGGGGASGRVGPGGGSGADQGRGGVGDAGGGTERPPEEGAVTSETVYDPPTRAAGGGDDVHLPGVPTDEGSEQEHGEVRGEGLRNRGLVPYRDVLADYSEEAARTIEGEGYPPRLRALVRDYFDRLGDLR